MFGAFENGTLVGVVTLVRETALKHRRKAKIVGVCILPLQRGSAGLQSAY